MASTFALIRKFYRLSWVDQILFLEAYMLLATNSVLIALLPYGYLRRLANAPLSVRRPSPERQRAIIDRIRYAVTSCARYIPLRALCFEQGLTTHRMLRRRGIRSTLYFGAAPTETNGLVAHVWVRAEKIDVVGCESAADYAVLETFPTEGAGIGQ